MKKKTKLAIVVSHPIQHFIHFYKAINRCDNIDLLVIYASDLGARKYYDQDMKQEISWDINLFDGYESLVLPESPNIKKSSFFSMNNPSVTKELKKYSPDVVKLHGYAQLTILRALAWCYLNKVPAILWGDSELQQKRSFYKSIIKMPILSFLFNFVSAFLTVGDNNENYYKHYGVLEKKLFRTPFTIDENLYLSIQRDRNNIRKKFRGKYKISDQAFVSIFIGKLIKRKRPQDLVEVVKRLNQKLISGREVYALFAGNGEMMGELKELCLNSGIPCIFLGFVNVHELPNVYAAADVLVHPAEVDPHPLIISEANFLGLPMIMSDRVGAIGPTDTARPGKNTIVFECKNINSLEIAFTKLYSDKGLCKKMSEQSIKISKELDINKSIKGLQEAINFVVN